MQQQKPQATVEKINLAGESLLIKECKYIAYIIIFLND